MNKTFFTADPHYGHAKIIEYEARPFSDVKQMNEILVKNWNSVVTQKDKVFVLGDISFHSKEVTTDIISQLYGRKILIYGNHDKGRNIQWWYDVGFDEVYKYPIIYDDFIFLSHEPPHYIPPNTPYFYLYGHIHGSEMYQTITKTSSCVSVERWNYTPVEFSTIQLLSKIGLK